MESSRSTAYLLLVVLMVLAADDRIWIPFWVLVGCLFVAERVVTVWRGGWRARLLAVTLFPELAYALVLNAVYVKGVLDIAFRRQASWKHVVQSPAPGATGGGA